MAVWTGGRWQPFTKTHRDLTDRLVRRFDKVYIGIRYVPERSRGAPFDPEEVAAMIECVYPDNEKVETFFLRRYNPFAMKAEIQQHVPAGVPFYTRQKSWSYGVRLLRLPVIYEPRDGGAATDVRDLWYRGDERFADFVPRQVADYMSRPEVKARIPDVINKKAKFGIKRALAKGLTSK